MYVYNVCGSVHLKHSVLLTRHVNRWKQLYIGCQNIWRTHSLWASVLEHFLYSWQSVSNTYRFVSVCTYYARTCILRVRILHACLTCSILLSTFKHYCMYASPCESVLLIACWPHPAVLHFVSTCSGHRSVSAHPARSKQLHNHSHLRGPRSCNGRVPEYFHVGQEDWSNQPHLLAIW